MVWRAFRALVLASAALAATLKYSAVESVLLRDPPSDSPEGAQVVCQSLLHPAIHDDHLKPFGVAALGADLFTRFDSELKRRCKSSFTAEAYAQYLDHYEGSWESDSATDLDNEILNGLGTWLNAERKKTGEKGKTWEAFAKPDGGTDTSRLLEGLAAHPTEIPIRRAMDFGCGGGEDLVALGLAQEDNFCLDVYDGVSPEARDKVTFMLLDSKTPEAYLASLDQYRPSVRGKVSVAYSMVTFHHVSQPKMRVDALRFIQEALAPGGIFVMAEWDNPKTPVDYTVYYDLVHFLPMLMLGDEAKSEGWDVHKLDCSYESLADWKSQLAAQGLAFDGARSKVPMTDGGGPPTLRSSSWMKDHLMNRNFIAVFGAAPPTTANASALEMRAPLVRAASQ